MIRFKKFLSIVTCIVFVLTSINLVRVNAEVNRPQGWTEVTHGKKADPNYSLVFPDDKVNRIDIIISSENYNKMETDVKGIGMMSTNDPIYVPGTIKFNGFTWTNVGVRYKGESTLTTPLQNQKHKLPFHLKFDEFEDQYPEIQDQRFYGFKELKLGNNWYDASFIRDKLTSDVFRSAGVPTAHGAFYKVYVDVGSGPVYWGLYTGFEDPSNKMLDTQFADDKGNLYKGVGAYFGFGMTSNGADLTVFNKAGYEKKTNKTEDNWSDLQALVSALNAPRTNAFLWRENLEKVFNVNLFLRWLAINTAITNFDTYGWVTKNHYLYQDLADNGRMVYIPWDFNLSLTEDPFGMMGMTGMGGFGGFGGNTIPATLSLNEINNSWPLIRYLIDDPVYKNIYNYEMKNAMNNCFNETTITSKISQLEKLIRPYTVGVEGEKSPYTFLTNGTTQFNQAITDLKSLVTKRHNAVKAYLSTITISPTPAVSKKPSPTQTPVPTAAGYKISGYIAPDFISNTSSVKAGFNVEVSGTSLTGTTDINGYFEINNVSANSNGYSLRITKGGFLSREIRNVVVDYVNVKLGNSDFPIAIWAGDVVINGKQDDAINMGDVLLFATKFNSTKGDVLYDQSFDFNLDNSINMSDVLIMARNFNRISSDYPLNI